MDEDVAELEQEVVCVATMKRLNTKGLVLVCTDEVDNVYLRVGMFMEDSLIPLRNEYLNQGREGKSEEIFTIL